MVNRLKRLWLKLFWKRYITDIRITDDKLKASCTVKKK